MTTANYVSDSNSPYVILVALSTDETGDLALYEAARIAASRPNSELHVVHVVEENGTAESDDEFVTLEHRLERAPTAIEGVVNRFQRSLPARVTAHVRAGEVWRSILQAAVDLNADLIVVGSHRRTRLEKMIVGSNAERVLRNAHCPVLVAVLKNYEGATKSQSIEPPCAECLVVRQETHGATFWCDRHRRAYTQPHVYSPSSGRSVVSVMPTH